MDAHIDYEKRKVCLNIVFFDIALLINTLQLSNYVAPFQRTYFYAYTYSMYINLINSCDAINYGHKGENKGNFCLRHGRLVKLNYCTRTAHIDVWRKKCPPIYILIARIWKSCHSHTRNKSYYSSMYCVCQYGFRSVFCTYSCL